MSIASVVHQFHAQRLIQRAIAENRLPHAYLFHGPDGVGKEKLATTLTQLLLCDNPIERSATEEQSSQTGLKRYREGCAACDECRLASAGTHPDLHLIYRQLSRQHPDAEVRKRKALGIGVDVIRHFVINKVGVTPVRGRAKVFVIREADRITAQAQNALLKTLEEPPGTTFLILLVKSLDLLLPTTLSRCQIVRFDPLPFEFVRSKLAEAMPSLTADQLDWYARFADGSAGSAIEFAEDGLFAVNQRVLVGLCELNQPIGTGRSKGRSPKVESGPNSVAKAWIDESKELGPQYRERDADISPTEASRRGLKSILRFAATWYADALRVNNNDPSSLTNMSLSKELQELKTRTDPGMLIEAVQRIAHAERQLDLNVHTQLCIEALVTDLLRIIQGQRVGAI